MRAERPKRRRSSLIVTYAAYFAIYSLVVALLLGLLGYLNSLHLARLYPSLDDFLQYENLLYEDRFSEIPIHQFEDSSFLILDQHEDTLYCSNPELLDYFHHGDLRFINDYYNGGSFHVYQHTEEDSGELLYFVMQTGPESSDSITEFSNYCILDEDLNILTGGLFADRTALTRTQFDLLSGTFQGMHMIQRYAYQNAADKSRILLFISPLFEYDEYSQNYDDVNRLWLLSIPMMLLTILLLSALFTRKMLRSIAPLNRAIIEYGKGNRIDPEETRFPVEFRQVMNNFDHLLDQLEESKRETERAYQDRQQTLASLSHDIRTPLTVIQGYTRALNDGVIPPERQKQYFRVIHERAEAMAELTESLQSYTQMELADYPIHLENTDFCEFCRSYFAEKYTELELRRFELDIDLPEERIPADIDHKLFKRIFENLISNALRSNPPGTLITVRLAQGTDSITLTIADNGLGIPEELRAHIFEPFVSGNRARTAGQGSGLGLSIARKIAHLHGGEIVLKTPPAPEFVTEFELTLPRARQ